MDVDSAPEPLEDALPALPAPADEEHPPRSSDEEDDSDEEGGESNSSANDELTTLDVDDDLAEGQPLPLEILTGYILVSSAPASLTVALVKRLIVLRLGIGWLKETITRQSQVCTRHLYDCRVFVDRETAAHTQREAAVVQVLGGRLVGRGILGAAGVPCSCRWV